MQALSQDLQCRPQVFVEEVAKPVGWERGMSDRVRVARCTQNHFLHDLIPPHVRIHQGRKQLGYIFTTHQTAWDWLNQRKETTDAQQKTSIRSTET